MSGVTVTIAREAVYERFATQWGALNPSLPFTLDNEAFDGDAQTTSWCRVAVRTIGGGQYTLGATGSRVFRRQALILVQVFSPINDGMTNGSTLAKQAADIFEGTSFSGLDCQSAVIRETGPDGKWYQHTVEVRLDYDEIK